MKHNLRHLLAGSCLAFSVLAGCGSDVKRGETVQSGDSKIVRRQGEPDMMKVPDEDKAVNKAIQDSRKTVGTFIAALQSPKQGQEKFSVKKPFREGKMVEHIWLTNITYDGSLFHGQVGNDPVDVKNIKLGDNVTVPSKEISDWMFGDKGKLVGGYTIRVLYNRLSAADKEQFKQQFELKLE